MKDFNNKQVFVDVDLDRNLAYEYDLLVEGHIIGVATYSGYDGYTVDGFFVPEDLLVEIPFHEKDVLVRTGRDPVMAHEWGVRQALMPDEPTQAVFYHRSNGRIVYKVNRWYVPEELLALPSDVVDEVTVDEEPSFAVSDSVNHPTHYTRGNIEVIDFIEDQGLNYHRGNAVKYISRAGHKSSEIEDLEKARWYIDREITNLKRS